MPGDEAEPHSEAASEVRHRTANTLQLLATLARMRGQKTTDLEARRQMIWMAESIGALGALERQRTPDGIDFSSYLQEMALVWRRRIAGQAADVQVEAVPFIVRDQAASTLALVTSELVANALQHGAPAEGAHQVGITLLPEGQDAMHLSVSDNGSGPADGPHRERFGLWLARSLAGQVRGTLEIAETESGGTRACLRFPR